MPEVQRADFDAEHTELGQFFWDGAARSKLFILRCDQSWVHSLAPPGLSVLSVVRAQTHRRGLSDVGQAPSNCTEVALDISGLRTSVAY